MSSNTSSVISCQLDQPGNKHQLARPTLTLGASQDNKDHQQQLSTMLHVQAAGGYHHQEQQHFITSLQVHNNGGSGNNNNNNIILSCSSVCSSLPPPPSAPNGEVSDQNTAANNGNGNMHNLFEVDFM
jgi:hypothetical protein